MRKTRALVAVKLNSAQIGSAAARLHFKTGSSLESKPGFKMDLSLGRFQIAHKAVLVFELVEPESGKILGLARVDFYCQ